MIMIKKVYETLLQLKGDVYPEELAARLKLKGRDLDEYWRAVKKLEKQGRIKFTGKGALKLKKGKPEALYTGKIEINSKGFGFVILEDKAKFDRDIFVNSSNLNTAMHGDKVQVRVLSNVPGKNPEGEVVDILERAIVHIVGDFMLNGKVGFVIPDNKKIAKDIFIPTKQTNGAQNGQKVVVEITKFAEGERKCEGRITEILGSILDDDIEIMSIIKQYGLSPKFPEKVLQAAKKVPQTVTKEECKARRDLRQLPIVTIDGDDAKDLDDAVYVERHEDGSYLLGVYIADVSYYVKDNSVIDLEARDRATSVYLVDRVLPMLPVELSNNICSLNANVDRLAMGCEMLIDKQGKVRKYEVFPAVIKVVKRLTYALVKQMLTGEGTIKDTTEYEFLRPELEKMRELCAILKDKRHRRGAIDFNFPEQKVKLDEHGKPLEIVQREQGLAESIIEEFMLAANETVAEHLSKLNYTSIYRVHELPDDSKITSLRKLLHNFNIKLEQADEIKPIMLQKALAEIQGRPEERLVSTVMLRSLKQARYQIENDGHFGLAAEYYTHFTSPIRRYPDLIIHRLLREYFEYGNKLPKAKHDMYLATLPDIAENASSKERKAADAERQTVELKMAEYMQEHIGEEFEGNISSITSFGFFVELDNGVEGLVHITALLDDYYVHDEEQYTLRGERRGNTYRLGDRIRIEVLNVNAKERTIDFIPAGASLETKLMLKSAQGARGQSQTRKEYVNAFFAKSAKGKAGAKGKNMSVQARNIRAAAEAGHGSTGESGRGKKKTERSGVTNRDNNKNKPKSQTAKGKRKATSKAGEFAQGFRAKSKKKK